MPPKRNTRAAPAAAAVVAGRGGTPIVNAAAADRNGRRRAREEPAEEQRVVRARQEVAEVRSWRLDSHVSDILFQRIGPDVGNKTLKEFVERHLGINLSPDVRNPLMGTVVTNPNRFIPQELREDIESLEAFQQLRDAYLLKQRGVDTLRQWRDFGDKGIVSPRSRGILDGVEVQNTEILQGGQVLAGLYESIYDAKWDYVVKNPKGRPARFWLEVKEDNFPPSLEWTDGEVDFSQPVAGREVPWDEFEVKERHRKEARKREHKENKNNAKPTQERLMMKVLTSPKGWPYGLYKKDNIFDCFVTKEVERAWRVVRGDLRAWFEADPRVLKKPRQRVLIGTPGIGKSMGVGSYLLYQLMQYDAEILPVVAYFIGKKTYIFNKITKQVTLYDDVMGLTIVEQLADNYNGYTIYDCSKRTGEPPVDLPESWGTVVISSPNENNFKGWVKQKTACRFIINCPEESDIKAMWVWNMRAQTDGPQMDWASIKNCMSNVGPIPRFLFTSDGSYIDRFEDVDRALGTVNRDTVIQYYGVNKDGLWRSEGVTHVIVKITRLVRSNGAEIFVNKPICPELKEKIRGRVSEVLKTDAALMAILLPLHELIPCILEEVGVKAFKEKNFVERIRNKLTEFRPKDSRRPGKPWVLYDNIAACPDDLIAIPQKSAVITKIQLQFKKLYDPSSKTFPVVDGFFFVENPRKTIVGIQVTTREDHDTTTSKVKELREYLAALFVDGDKISEDFTWEIIYVQHTDNKTMTRWQECKKVLQQGQGPEDDMTRGEADAIEKHWNEEVRQYHLKISSEDVRDNN